MDDYERADVRMDLGELLVQLTPNYREALLLCYWYGYTQREAGEVMGVTQPSIHRYIARAREELTRLGCIK